MALNSADVTAHSPAHSLSDSESYPVTILVDHMLSSWSVGKWVKHAVCIVVCIPDAHLTFGLK